MKEIKVKEISGFVEEQGTLVQQEDFEQVPVCHLTVRNYSINDDIIMYVGCDGVYCESGSKYLYKELTFNEVSKVLGIINN